MAYKKRLIGGALQGVLLFREDANGDVLPSDVGFVDRGSGALTVLDFSHHKIHKGDHYTASERVTLGAAATREYLITTADSSKVPHFLYAVSSGLSVTIDLFEETTKTGGTAVPSLNNNRRSGNTAETTVTHSPGGAGDGTQILYDSAGGTGGGRSGGEARGENEYLLKRNTKYLLRITSGDANNVISIRLHWYENTPYVT